MIKKLGEIIPEPVWFFLLARIILLISLPLDGLEGYGDWWNYSRIAESGLPFVDFWVEFPPVFPFVLVVFRALSSGVGHNFEYLLAISASLVQAMSLVLFLRILERLKIKDDHYSLTVWFYTLLLVVLPYGWWYIDSWAVSFLLLGLYWMLEGRDVRAGIAIGLGVLTKLFPGLALVIPWRFFSLRRSVIITVSALGLTLFVWLALAFASPSMTRASVRVQYNKGSWETIWALIDENLHTGNLNAQSDRFDPGTATFASGNPPRIPSWITIIPFSAVGLCLYTRIKERSNINAIRLLLLTWSIFLIWSPGWSPQWVLYLLPLILIVFPDQRGMLLSAVFTLISLLEWPVLLSRGLFWTLWALIPARTLLLILIAVLCWMELKQDKISEPLHEDALRIG